MRRRILLIIGTTLALMLAMIWVATRTILMKGFERMERSAMEDNLERVRAALDRDLDALSGTASDWASRDDVRQGLGDPALANLGLDMLLLVSPEGRITYVRALQQQPADLDSLLARYPFLVGPTREPQPTSGLAVLDGDAWLLAAYPVPSRGTLVLARRLDQDEIAHLSTRVHLKVRIVVPGALHGDDPTLRAFGRLSRDPTPVIERPAVDRLTAYGTLRDLAGAPALGVVIETQSEIRLQAMRSAVSSMVWIALSGVVFGAAVLLFLQRRILARLHSVSSQVLAIKTGDQPSKRLEVDGTDQIAYLAAAINGMLAALESSTEELRTSDRQTQALLDAVPDLILLIAPDGTVRSLRLPEWSVPGLSDDIVGMELRSLDAVFPVVAAQDKERIALAVTTARERQLPQTVELDLELAGSRRSLEVRVVATAAGETVFVGRDVTMRRQAEEAERNETLLKEIHHRVRNNLQLISSLLGLQASSTEDAEAKTLLAESQDRIRSMALIHERLTQASPAGVSGFAAYIGDLVEHLGRSYAAVAGHVEIVTSLEDVPLPAAASLPAGLITSELLTNAFRHAFPEGRTGKVRVSLGRGTDGRAVLAVEDDGVGLPPEVKPEEAATLGFRIVASLVKQLGARLEVTRAGGTCFRLVLGET